METALLDRIQRDPGQPRTVFNPDETQAFAGSLWTNGLVQPIVVIQLQQPEPNSTTEQLTDCSPDLQILTGERRYLAFLENRKRAAAVLELSNQGRNLKPGELERAERYACWTEIPITLHDPDSPPWRLRILQLVENTDRVPLTLADAAAAWTAAFEASGLSQNLFAAEAGLPRVVLSAYLLCSRATTGHLGIALKADLLRDPQAVSLFTRLSNSQQEAMIRHAQKSGQPISRVQVSAAHSAEEQAKTRAQAAAEAKPPAPPPVAPPPPLPASKSLASDQPFLPLAAASWLVDHLATVPEPLAREIQGTLSHALDQGSPYIFLRETGYDPKPTLASTGAGAP